MRLYLLSYEYIISGELYAQLYKDHDTGELEYKQLKNEPYIKWIAYGGVDIPEEVYKNEGVE